MGAVFKKTFTKPLPAEHSISERDGARWARWRGADGKPRSGRVVTGSNGVNRVLIEATKYSAKFRDGAGIVRVVATGCRDEDAARRVLSDLERRAELVKANVISRAEDAVADHQAIPLENHLEDYATALRARGVTAKHAIETRRYLNKLAGACRLQRLADIERSRIETWLAAPEQQKKSARLRNAARGAIVAFCQWAVDAGRLIANPVSALPIADEQADPRRKPRALTAEEVRSLLDAAERRPIEDAMIITRGASKGKRGANVSAATRDRLMMLGCERRLIYATLVMTGLRINELRTLTVGQVSLESTAPSISLDAADEKNRNGSTLSLSDELASELRAWLAAKLEERQRAARVRGDAVPSSVDPSERLFNVTGSMTNVFERDRKAAGIKKRDDRGRIASVHALRHTFGTWMARGGVSQRVAQEAMRHSDPALTANLYTDPRLLSTREAVNVVALQLVKPHEKASAPMADQHVPSEELAPPLAPTTGPESHFDAPAGTTDVATAQTTDGAVVDATSCPDKDKRPVSFADTSRLKWRRSGLNRRPSDCEPDALPAELRPHEIGRARRPGGARRGRTAGRIGRGPRK